MHDVAEDYRRQAGNLGGQRIQAKTHDMAQNADDHRRTPAESFEEKPRYAMVAISAIWPMLIAGAIQFSGTPILDRKGLSRRSN